MEAAAARRWVHIAGLAWVGVCATVLWHAIAGKAPMEITGAMWGTVAFLGAWAATAVVALRAWGPSMRAEPA